MRFKILSFSLLLFVVFNVCSAKPPQLTAHDTKIKIEEILKAHVSYQKLTPELVKRSLQNYIDELDPVKTYFLASDILEWLEPSEELLTKTLEGIKREDFTAYERIHQKMISAIERRGVLEVQIAQMPLPKGVDPSEFKDMKWTEKESELQTRLLRLKALQIESAEKLDATAQELMIQRLTKRRLNREEELLGQSSAERYQVVLSYVLKATSSALDSQTAYFTPAEANQFMIQVQQRLFGIGAQLRDDLNGFTIMRILEGGPASSHERLKIGDRIIAVNQELVVGMDITEAVELIRGPKGTSVHLTILREVGEGASKNEEKFDLDIVRGEIVLKESRFESHYEPYGDGVIGILHLFSFYQDASSSSASDLKAEIEKLKKEHLVKAIILDLRSNAGGLLPQAVSVTGLFIKKGIVVSVKDNTGVTQHLRNIEEKQVWDGPLVVLTSRTSASAAEIVAQTLQDYGRAILVGDSETYGKGTFQTFTLESANYGKVNPKGEYKVTRGMYYTVSGKTPQMNGVHTDIVVPGVFSQLDIGEKFSKFPLQPAHIPPNFNDDLSDIPLIHRSQIKRYYQFDLQQVLSTYTAHLPQLTKNSQKRLLTDKNYQNFLKEIAQKDSFSESMEHFGQNDLQLEEALNIMKDFIFLLKESQLNEKIAG